MDNNCLLKDIVKKAGTKYYCFDQDGRMRSGDMPVEYYGPRYLLADGTFLKNGWKKIGGEWYYYGSDGSALTGTWELGETTYHLKTPPSVNSFTAP